MSSLSSPSLINTLYGGRQEDGRYSRLTMDTPSYLALTYETRNDNLGHLQASQDDFYTSNTSGHPANGQSAAAEPLLEKWNAGATPNAQQEGLFDMTIDEGSSDAASDFMRWVDDKILRKRRVRRLRCAALFSFLLVCLSIAAVVFRLYKPTSSRSAPGATDQVNPALVDSILKSGKVDDESSDSGPSFAFGESAAKYECCNPTFDILPTRITPIKAMSAFSESQLDKWIAEGEVPNNGLDLSRHARIDGVTMWVNGSDVRHKQGRAFFSKHLSSIDQPSWLSHQKQRAANAEAKAVLLNKRTSKFGQYNSESNLQNSDKHYRELNELLYSVRSARVNLREYLGTHHIISTDFWDRHESSESGISSSSDETSNELGITDRLFARRRGQLPQWLDTKSPLVAFGSDRASELVAVRMHHDWETFVPLNPSASQKGHDAFDADAWRKERLPTFSSSAAEAVVGVNMPGLSEAFFLASDDMFITDTITTADFYTPLFGPVLHLELNRIFHGIAKPHLGDEQTGHEFSVQLLAKRFGTRSASYPAHMVKSQLQPLILESRIMFRDAFEAATARRFRGDGRMANSHMLGYGMLIERHREALLWSFFVAKLDRDGDGYLDSHEYDSMLRQIGASGEISGKVEIDAARHPRSSIDQSHVHSVLDRVRFPRPEQSRYRFSSFDGYPYTFFYSENEATKILMSGVGRKKTPLFDTGHCTIDLNVCLPHEGKETNGSQPAPSHSVEDILKRFSFEVPQCGNCLIQHLVGQSGSRGLEAFLPTKDSGSFPAENAAPPSDTTFAGAYHLPLTDDWRTTNFSLAAVAADNELLSVEGGVTTLHASAPSRRAFVVSLLARYTYVVAEAPSEFQMLRTPGTARTMLDKLAAAYKSNPFSFLCINDDIVSGLDEVRGLLQSFFSRLWPHRLARLPFERRT